MPWTRMARLQVSDADCELVAFHIWWLDLLCAEPEQFHVTDMSFVCGRRVMLSIIVLPFVHLWLQAHSWRASVTSTGWMGAWCVANCNSSDYVSCWVAGVPIVRLVPAPYKELSCATIPGPCHVHSTRIIHSNFTHLKM